MDAVRSGAGAVCGWLWQFQDFYGELLRAKSEAIYAETHRVGLFRGSGRALWKGAAQISQPVDLCRGTSVQAGQRQIPLVPIRNVWTIGSANSCTRLAAWLSLAGGSRDLPAARDGSGAASSKCWISSRAEKPAATLRLNGAGATRTSALVERTLR